jgi:hypothetical protein
MSSCSFSFVEKHFHHHRGAQQIAIRGDFQRLGHKVEKKRKVESTAGKVT